MHIVIGTHYFLPHMGGIENVASQHAKQLTDRGHTVTFLTSRLKGDERVEHRDGYRILRYRTYNPLEQHSVPYPLPDPISFHRAFTDAVSDTPVDVFHLHGLNYLSTTLTLAHANSETPVVLHQHTPFVKYSSFLWLVESLNDRTVGRWNLSQCDHVLCVSENIREYVEYLDPTCRRCTFPNGVDTARFHPQRARSRVPLNTTDVPFFLSLSRPSEKKGTNTVIEAAKLLERRDVDAQIVLAGAGSKTGKYAQEVAALDNVEVIGYVPDEMLPVYYASATGFIFSSKTGEAFPTLTVLESFASGTPVVASKIDERAEGIEDGRNVLFVTPGNPIEFADAIQRLAEDEEAANEMGERARATAVDTYSIHRRIDELESVYEVIVGEPSVVGVAPES